MWNYYEWMNEWMYSKQQQSFISNPKANMKTYSAHRQSINDFTIYTLPYMSMLRVSFTLTSLIRINFATGWRVGVATRFLTCRAGLAMLLLPVHLFTCTERATSEPSETLFDCAAPHLGSWEAFSECNIDIKLQGRLFKCPSNIYPPNGYSNIINCNNHHWRFC